ncbi:MAG: ABC transporter permease [Chloroflexi bacterium]|nr:ABC transporter permease [Chloroflexota bacterium]MCC6897079.1 ABC transporter permease [Anaerolineae bacterium]
MNKTLLVAQREYLFNLKRRSFLFAVFGVPVFTFVVWAVVFVVMSDSDNTLGANMTYGYVDQSGILADPVTVSDAPQSFEPYADETSARAALDEKIIGAYFLLPENYLRTGEVQSYSYDSLPQVLQDAFKSFLLANLSRGVETDFPVDRIQQPVTLTIHPLDSGRTLTEANLPALVFIPLIFSFVFLMSSNVTSGFLMGGIVEERSNRIMEILVTSITPTQLLMGKILGLGVLGLTQLVVWGGAGLILINVGQQFPFLNGISFPLDLMVVFVIFFLVSYFLLASLMAGIGAVVGSEQESRQFASLISLILVIPFFFLTTFINNPNSNLALALSFIPFTSPITILLRMGFGSVPFWQIAVSLLILLVTTLFVIWASARVFRWGLLLYGKRIGIRQLIRVIWSSPEMGVSHSGSARGNE